MSSKSQSNPKAFERPTKPKKCKKYIRYITPENAEYNEIREKNNLDI